MNKEDLFLIGGILSMIAVSSVALLKWEEQHSDRTVKLRLNKMPQSLQIREKQLLLSYQINHLNLNEIPAQTRAFEKGDRVFVILKTAKQFSFPVRIYQYRPDNTFYIAGRVENQEELKLTCSFGIEKMSLTTEKEEQIKEMLDRKSRSTKSSPPTAVIHIEENGRATVQSISLHGHSISL